MDENAFKHALGSVNPQPCVFEKAILTRRCHCDHINKRYLAEREMIACVAPAQRKQCDALLALLRQNSAFALKLTHVHPPLAHAQELKVQCGGLLGLQQTVDGKEEVVNVAALLAAAIHKYGNLEDFPYSQIVQSVVSCRVRQSLHK